MTTLQEKITYIGHDKFVKFSNTANFPKLSNSTKHILTNIGIYSDPRGYPYLYTDGKLEKLNEDLIIFGRNRVLQNPFCIDMANNERIVFYDKEEETIDIVNTTLEKYIECLYATYKFSEEYELKEKLGSYQESHKRYAEKLLEMYQEIEPDILNFPTWSDLVHEMNLGVL